MVFKIRKIQGWHHAGAHSNATHRQAQSGGTLRGAACSNMDTQPCPRTIVFHPRLNSPKMLSSFSIHTYRVKTNNLPRRRPKKKFGAFRTPKSP